MQARFYRRKIVKTQTFGEFLREARLARHYGLEEVAEKTLINKDMIEALEKGEYEALPARVYVEGYIEKLAKFLQMNPEETLRLYQKETKIKEHMETTHGYASNAEKLRTFKNPRLWVSPAAIRNIVIGAVLLFGVGYLWYEVSSLSNPPEIILVQPTGDQEVDSNELVVFGQAALAEELTINGQLIFIGEDGEFRETLTLQPGTNTIEITAVNRLGKETVKTLQIFSTIGGDEETSGQEVVNLSETPGPVEPVNTRSAVAGESEGSAADAEGATTEQAQVTRTLSIEIQDLATWIQVEADGEVIFSGTMLPGSSRSFEATEYLSLTSGKPHKTFVTFDGQEVGILGEEGGVVRDVRFDAETDLSQFGL